MKTYFERRRKVRHRYLGKLSTNMWNLHDYKKLLDGGWLIRFFLNGKEILGVLDADPDEGVIGIAGGAVLKGSVEIILERAIA